MPVDPLDREAARRIVRTGYDDASVNYTRFRLTHIEHEVAELLAELTALAPGGKLLDVGCGGGVLARSLTDRFQIIGVDVSIEQLRLARQIAREARYVCQDMVTLTFPDGFFDAVCAVWAIIHVPREDHASLLANFHRMLRPGGVALLSFGRTDYEGTENFFGGDIFWSHYDRDTSIGLVEAAEFEILRVVDVDDRPAAGTAPFVLARHPAIA